jgi:hypothetical protein
MAGHTHLVASLIVIAGALPIGTAFAQDFDPRTESPRVLLVAPSDGVAYRDARLRVERLLDERCYAEAEPLAESLTREYPRDGMNWLLLARARSNLGRPREAALAYERAGPLIGWGFWYSPRVNAAGEHVTAGNSRAALDLLRAEMFANRSPLRRELWDLPYLAPLRDDPEFREISGRADTTGWTRDYGWRRDLEHLHAEVKRVNPDYHDAPLPVEFENRFRALWSSVPRLTDEEIYVGMNRMLAVLRQGHTSMLSFPREERAPVTFYVFPEGLFIVNAIEEYRDLIGSRVIAVGNTAADEALRRVTELLSVDGDMEYLLAAPSRLRQMRLLVGLGIADSTEVLRLDVETTGGLRREVRVLTDPRIRVPGNMLAPPPDVPAK